MRGCAEPKLIAQIECELADDRSTQNVSKKNLQIDCPLMDDYSYEKEFPALSSELTSGKEEHGKDSKIQQKPKEERKQARAEIDDEDQYDSKENRGIQVSRDVAFPRLLFRNATLVATLRNQLARANAALADMESQMQMARLIHSRLLNVDKGDILWVAKRLSSHNFFKGTNSRSGVIWYASEVKSVIAVSTGLGLKLEILTLDRMNDECLCHVWLRDLFYTGVLSEWPVWPIFDSLEKTRVLIEAMFAEPSHFADYSSYR